VWRGETKLGETYDTIDIPADLQGQGRRVPHQACEAVAETDRDAAEKYFGGESLIGRGDQGCAAQADDQLEAYLVLCGSAFQNKGVQPC